MAEVQCRRLAVLGRHIGFDAAPAASARPRHPQSRRPSSCSSSNRAPAAGAAQPAPRHGLQGLTEVERYWFDTQGYVVVPGVLTAVQLAACNEALDRNRARVKYTPLSEDGRA
jgi:hypothetical protein